MTVIVNGLDQIQRDLARSGPEVNKAVHDGLRAAAEPVSKLAENLSLTKIRRMRRSPEWAVTRIGITRSAVYIVPRERGVKSRNPFDRRRRPNLVNLMLGRSFEPAVERMAPVVDASVVRLLDRVIS